MSLKFEAQDQIRGMHEKKKGTDQKKYCIAKKSKYVSYSKAEF